jgi:integrase/recombinase XerC
VRQVSASKRVLNSLGGSSGLIIKIAAIISKDLNYFLAHEQGLTVGNFLRDGHLAYEISSRYRGILIEQGKSGATINRRLSALKSLTAYCYQCGHCEFTLEAVKGIDVTTYKEILETCDLTMIRGIRDYAILTLLWSNALRRSEVSKCNVSDFNPKQRTLKIFGKGRGTQSEIITLGQSTANAIALYLNALTALPDEQFSLITIYTE